MIDEVRRAARTIRQTLDNYSLACSVTTHKYNVRELYSLMEHIKGFEAHLAFVSDHYLIPPSRRKHREAGRPGDSGGENRWLLVFNLKDLYEEATERSAPKSAHKGPFVDLVASVPETAEWGHVGYTVRRLMRR